MVAQAFTTARPRHQLAELYPALVFHTCTHICTRAYFTWVRCIAFQEIRGCASLADAAVIPRVSRAPLATLRRTRETRGDLRTIARIYWTGG